MTKVPKPEANASKTTTEPSKQQQKGWDSVTRRNTSNRRPPDNKRRGNGRNGPSLHKPPSTSKIKFVGRTAEIKDHILTTGDNSGAIFSKSKKEILHHIGKRASEVSRAIIAGKEHVFQIPEMPQVPNPNCVWGAQARGANNAEPEFTDKPEKDFNMVDKMML